jgi:hypothetical protein
MQRTAEELSQMSHEELVNRVLEMQDILKEGLAVRESLHRILNDLLKAKADEVAHYAGLDSSQLVREEQLLKSAWAKARHAVSNPIGAAMKLK